MALRRNVRDCSYIAQHKVSLLRSSVRNYHPKVPSEAEVTCEFIPQRTNHCVNPFNRT
ncbi:MAG: hypothetical protein ACKERF_00180 [Candidatus Hodgkinia cicadicola]